MDSKKRPNDDIATSDAHDDPMDVSDAILSAIVKEASTIHPNPATVTAATMVTENTVPGEPNKRLKLTQEHDKAGADYSPSADVADPAKETKDLTEWVDHMDEDKALPIVPSSDESSPVKKADAHSDTTSDNVDPVQSLVSPEVPTKLSDSILAVASLPEPLVTTLEALESEASAVPSEDTEPKEPSEQASAEETPASQSEILELKETNELVTPSTTEKAPQDSIETTSDLIKPQEAQTIEKPKEESKSKEVSGLEDTSEPIVPSIPETCGNSVPPQQPGDDVIMAEVEEDTLATSALLATQQPSTETLDQAPSKELVVKAPTEEPVVKAPAEDPVVKAPADQLCSTTTTTPTRVSAISAISAISTVSTIATITVSSTVAAVAAIAASAIAITATSITTSSVTSTTKNAFALGYKSSIR
ncbi:hypothetical protein BG006_010481 [Podila minutissima]|uniref:Uncharacterized protein n=1 Tax=Podila minutissima TaxID=64525 RepID=A0A9P5VQ33_9FUNG|nr:hypothetical protein BG006_010481 [Podila minutissima]